MANTYKNNPPKGNLKIYYARAMDNIQPLKISSDDEKVKKAFRPEGFAMVNPYNKKQKPLLGQADELAEYNLKLIKKSDVLLANLSIQNYTYIGAIFEIVQAVNHGIPTVVYIGNSNLANRYYLHSYCNFICYTLKEAIEYIRRCWSTEGINNQTKEAIQFYDQIAIDYERMSRKKYKNKDTDINRYKKERDQLKEKLKEYCCGKVVLELGCGAGEWTQIIAENAKSVICIEASRNMIIRAKERLKTSTIQPHFIQGNFLDGTLTVKACDVIVCYFTLSFLPPRVQNDLLANMKRWISKDGFFLFGESRQISTLPSVGLGRQRIQTRVAHQKDYIIYKEHFTPYQLEILLKINSFQIKDLPSDNKWFSFCAARIK